MSKETPAGELLPCPFCGESAETDFIPEHHSYQIECSDCIGCYGRVIRDTEIGAIDAWNRRAADRELRRGDVAMPLLPEPHFGDGRYLGIALNGDAFTAAQMREYAQAALAAKDAEIAALKANRDRWKAIALMYNTKYSEGTVEITALKAERDALRTKIAIIRQDSNREYEDFRNCRDQLRVVLLDVARLKAERKPLTDEQIEDLLPTNRSMPEDDKLAWMARAVERAHGITGDGQ